MLSFNKTRYVRAAITPLIMTLLLLGVLFSSISPVSAQEIPREKILWSTGYDVPPTSFCPVIMDWGQGFDTYIIYEPLFGTNAAEDERIYWLGESIRWVDDVTIEVTLRNGIYWVKMLPNGTAVYDRPITPEDVQYSYYLYGGFDESPDGQYWHMNDFATRVGSMSNFEIVSPRVFRVHIKPEYASSSLVWRRILQSFLILPKHVWTEIEAAYAYIPEFANDWTDPAMPAEWKVASGMYLPYWNDHDARTIMKRNDNWWGINVFGRKPLPEYFGNICYFSNEVAAIALEAGEVDWSGNYIPGIDQIMVEHPNLHTYFKNPPYFGDALAKLMVPNHRKYPLNEVWLHQAIAHVLDFDTINSVSSNYLKPASPLLIPSDDAVARRLLNTTIEDEYRITRDPVEALAILNEHCIQVGGIWYTKDGPSQEWLDLYPDHEPFEDALPGELGINVPLGPWQLLDVAGWTDTNAIDVVIADEVYTELGITIEPYFIDFDPYVTAMDNMDFDFSHYCMSAGLNNDMYQRYSGMFTGPVGCWGHYGDYRNPELENLINSLDTAPVGSPEEQSIANQIQEIIGSQMPFIPIAGAPDWYIYNDQYWSGWPDEVEIKFLPCSPYGGSGQVANLQFIILYLRRLIGDVNNDCSVDMADISILIDYFMGFPGTRFWNPFCDINDDRSIDMADISFNIDHFMEAYP